MEPPARDGSIDSVLLESMPPRANGVVPSLHALCCELIGTTIINLDNAPSIVAFARAHNFPPLLQRAERFCCDSWSGLRKQHDAIELEQAVGTELFASLDKDQDDIEKRLRSMRRLGSVVDAPPAASASCSVPQAPKSTLAPAPAPSSARTKRFASFGGGGEVCLACSKRVYPAEMPTGVSIGSYHANCFRCATCQTKLASHSYERTDSGMLLCKAHYKQHLNVHRPKAGFVPPAVLGPSGVSGLNEACRRCGKKVFAFEKAVASAHQGGQGDSQAYHRACFRCADCNRGPLRPDDWAVDVKTGDLLCTVHFQSRKNAERLPESAAPAPAARAPGAATAPVVDVL